MTIDTCCAVVELRQYTLKPDRRDVLVELFERELVEAQEATGMRLIGQFRDLDRPDRFVWLRGFPDMPSRAASLEAFYGGPVWKAHRDAANATMIDSDNVLLLRPVSPNDGFALSKTTRAPAGASGASSSRIVATLCHLDGSADGAFERFFANEVEPVLAAAGAQPLACFVTEHSENTFPRLPVRTGENVFVWFTHYANAAATAASHAQLAASPRWTKEVSPALTARLPSTPERLVLAPTARSLLR